MLALLLALATLAPSASPAGVEVIYLANAGVLLTDGQRGVLLDGCVREPYSGYAAVADGVWADLLVGASPFARLDLVLVSHAHRDHFQVDAARELLLARPAARWVVHREVAAALAEGWDRWREVADRVEPVAPADAEPVVWRGPGLEVELRRLPHGAARTVPENLAHVVHLGGRTIVHVGDAGGSAAELARAGLAGRRFDVALLPFWYWEGERWRPAREMLRGRLGSLALHLPPGERPSAEALAAGAPPAPAAPLDRFRF